MWRRLEADDYDAVMALRQAVLSSLPDPDFYVCEDDEETFVRGHLDLFGESVGCFEGDDLVAYLALTTDLVSSGEDVEFAACAPTLDDVVFAAAMVLPDYRGRSLHRAGIRHHIAIAQELGARRGFAQISARNHRSLRSYFSEGFRCTRAVDYPDGRRRLLLERDLIGGNNTALIDDVALVNLDDFCAIGRELTDSRAGHRLLPIGNTVLMMVGTGRYATPRGIAIAESLGAEAEWSSAS
jgi:GNAT superfamily N-acetyltransferase